MILLQPVDQLNFADPEAHRRYGSKAARLAHLTQLGLPVPPALALSLPRHTDLMQLDTVIGDILGYFAARHHHGTVCLRSSTPSEDQADSSEAGQWSSWFSLPQQRDRLATALRDYLLHLERQLRARHSHTAVLSCLIQAEITCHASGVCFSRHPDPAYGPHSLVQYTDGHGSHFTDGRIAASTLLISHWSARPIVHRQQTLYTLDDAMVAQLHRTAMHLQTQFGGPQDIEFGVADGRLWIFQTRPVTAALAREDHHLWTRAAADEFWSGTVSATMWATVGDCIENYMLRRPLAALPDEHLWQQPLLKAHLGYVYLNADPVRRVLDALPGWARVDALQAMVGRDASWSLWPFAPLSFWRIVVAFLRAGFRWLPWMPFGDLERSALRGQAIFDAARAHPSDVRTSAIMAALEDHLSHAIWGMVWAYVLVQLAERTVRWLTRENEDAVSVTFGRNADDPVFQLDNAMRRAAHALAQGQSDASAAIVERYGHLAFGRDITQPRWHERPQAVASMVSATAPTPLAARSAFSVLQELSTMAWTTGSYTRTAAVWLLAPGILLGRRFVAWREAMRFGSDYYLAALRIALQPGAPAAHTDADMPMWLQGDQATESPLHSAAQPDSSARLYGTALYRGLIEGTVYVVHDAADTQHFPAGAILVSEYLDPSLGPLLSRVAGAVFEFGGVLSHGGILCREHRVPSLCGVRQATRRLRTGQRIRLNAVEGRIELLP